MPVILTFVMTMYYDDAGYQSRTEVVVPTGQPWSPSEADFHQIVQVFPKQFLTTPPEPADGGNRRKPH